MNHTINRLNRIVRTVFCFLMIGGVTNSLTGCKYICRTCCEEKPPQKPWYSSANLLLSSSVSDATIKSALRDAAEQAGGTLTDNDIKIRRCPCDTLINLELPPGWIIEGQNGEVAVRTPGGGQSGGVDLPGSGSLAVGLNFQINTFDPSQQQQRDKLDSAGRENFYSALTLVNSSSTKQIKIAVFDSGLFPGTFKNSSNAESYLPVSYLLTTNSCTNQRVDPANTNLTGWNFTTEDDPKNTTDRNIVHHGSRVANLIARQFNGSGILPQIVPMKVLNTKNQGDLYGLMCAMKTAQKNGVQVFNMSLGYYGLQDDLFRKYIEEADKAGIWIVVAAGNHLVDSTGLNRNLTTLKPQFYPATFAAEFKRVVPVTTVSKAIGSNMVMACIRQNYAKEYVVGAMDGTTGPNRPSECYFRMGDGPNGTPVDVFGTSYAAPVVAGWLGVQLAQSTSALTKRDDIPGRIPNANQGNGDQVMANKYVKTLP